MIRGTQKVRCGTRFFIIHLYAVSYLLYLLLAFFTTCTPPLRTTPATKVQCFQNPQTSTTHARIAWREDLVQPAYYMNVSWVGCTGTTSRSWIIGTVLFINYCQNFEIGGRHLELDYLPLDVYTIYFFFIFFFAHIVRIIYNNTKAHCWILLGSILESILRRILKQRGVPHLRVTPILSYSRGVQHLGAWWWLAYRLLLALLAL